jgi:hypothetical protein
MGKTYWVYKPTKKNGVGLITLGPASLTQAQWKNYGAGLGGWKTLRIAKTYALRQGFMAVLRSNP